MEGPLLPKARRDPIHSAQKEGCHDRRLKQELGRTVRGQTKLWPVVRREVGPAHQLPRNASSVSGLSILPAGHSDTPCANMLRQQVREWPSLPLHAFPPSRSATAGTQGNQGTTAQADSNSPSLEEPTVGFRVIPAAESSPVADPLEMGPPLSSERHDMASTARVMGPAFVAARWEPFVLLEHVLNTMAEVRAQSTRRLYALKWRPAGPFRQPCLPGIRA